MHPGSRPGVGWAVGRALPCAPRSPPTAFAARVRALGGDRDAVIGALDGSSAWSVVGTHDDLAIEHGAGSLTLRKVDGRPFDSFADLSDHLLFTGLDDFLASL